jgi:hypothetical protein
MRSRQFRLVASTLLVVFALSATPSFAARRGADPGDGFLDRIVKVIKHLVLGTLDDADTMSVPKP